MNPITAFSASHDWLPWALLMAAFVVCTLLSWRLLRLRRAHRTCLSVCDSARDGEQNVTRILRLFAQELQALALTLRGHADQLVAEAHPNTATIATVTAQLGGLADELEHHLTPEGARRALSCETLSLPALVAESVAAISAAIAPGRRHWQMPSGTELLMEADYRALRQVLFRVLGEAVRSSGQDDWIDISWSLTPESILVLVQDEGSGVVPSGATHREADSRGIGLRLSLARTLVLAHDGTMEVESLSRIGTRVTVALPIHRLRQSAPAPAPMKSMLALL
jgi:signal transduction histidine kinase